ncbi:hypothetical protein CLAFUW4_11633 [Fulvia fulva]|uniref:Uncharacterized protein n=1 Tax=Passalora fulva TaxID=5499 RepID=A0A9Q8PC33_PASFU|nr:uncharacterized protein CLAFUR5_10679 [Fulvia fulva]KAK4619353.1 hypothetical protein CLAFUR4_11638 [Fulvia fulva]KAK4621020.1 hypothetical protein CLAFUR0_11648 [Fulvia fulva]UJO19728.1 hypothetical protein CLAFUR5_10679 [Fulvia fulva]WPV17182.1 hypothetical protein CLAFUW4_11633 [Fulvia fulva]WPV32098.1 hypothetical protein CLAFUW7_11638 [Fulvia fulva]
MLPRPDLSLMQKACMMILAQGPGGHGGSQAEKLMPRYWSAIARLPYGRADLEQWCHHFRWLGMQHENTMSRDPLLESHSRTGIDSGFSTPYREQIIPAATPCTVTTDLQCEHNEHPDDHTHANQRKRPDQEPAERCDHKPRLTKIQARTQPYWMTSSKPDCATSTWLEETMLDYRPAFDYLESSLHAMKLHRMRLVITGTAQFRIAYDKARIGDLIFQLQHC